MTSPTIISYGTDKYVAVLDSSGWQFAYVSNGAIKPGAKGAFFQKAKALGVAGIIHRIGNGTSYDQSFRLAHQAAVSAGMPFGAYYYAQPARMTAAEAVKRVNAWLTAFPKLDIPLMLDWEEYHGVVLTKEKASAWINDFLVDTQGIIYAGNAFLNRNSASSSVMADSIQPRYPRNGVTPPSNPAQWAAWIPWDKQPIRNTIIGDWEGWQFSSDGAASDFGYPSDAATGRLDLNVVRLEAWNGWLARMKPPVATPPPPPEPPETWEITAQGNYKHLHPSPRIFDTRVGGGAPRTLWAVPIPKELTTDTYFAGVCEVTVTAVPVPGGASGYLSQGTRASFLNYSDRPVANTTKLKVWRDTITGAASVHIAASQPVHLVVDLVGFH